MKLNKSKNKGKVHPSPTSSSTSNNNNNKNDPISPLIHLLPSTILTLISLLSLQDKQVVAYMFTHSLNSSNTHKKTLKKTHKNPHITPTFDCCCFACFSSYWNLWNSSPNSKLIDQAIEAFEEHLSKTEKNNQFKRDKKRTSVFSVCDDVEERERHCLSDVEEREEKMVSSDDVEERESEDFPVAGKEEEERESGVQQQQQQQHKGLARKVLPDFIGLFQSRLWNRLWGPNV